MCVHFAYWASHPSWVCGLKLSDGAEMCDVTMSHPSWVCGLKQKYTEVSNKYTESHPSWVCGLKQLGNIQTDNKRGHTLRGCVD